MEKKEHQINFFVESRKSALYMVESRNDHYDFREYDFEDEDYEEEGDEEDDL